MVRSGHGPQAEVAQGLDLNFSLNTEVNIWKGWKRAVEQSKEQRRVRRRQPQRNTQVHMHGWDDACKADLSQGAM